MAKQNKLKINTPFTFPATPVGTTTPSDVNLEELLNSLQLGSDLSFIRVSGKLYKQSVIRQAIEDAVAPAAFTFVEFGTNTTSAAFTYDVILNSIKTYGLGPIIKLSNKFYITKTIATI